MLPCVMHASESEMCIRLLLVVVEVEATFSRAPS
jgi:hypothetical protein